MPGNRTRGLLMGLRGGRSGVRCVRSACAAHGHVAEPPVRGWRAVSVRAGRRDAAETYQRPPRVSCSVAVVLALCAALAGCAGSDGGGGSGGKVVLRYTWWGNPDRAARTEKALALFEKRHPGIRVQTSFSGYDAYKQKLATQAAGGDAPD